MASPTRIYHLPRSRSTRVLWALEEIGVPFEVTLMTGAIARATPSIARHALGRVPVIEDDAGYLFESAAIVLALADRHPDRGLSFPLGTRERELVYQWVLFAMAELEPLVVQVRDESRSGPAASAGRRRALPGSGGPGRACRPWPAVHRRRPLSAADIMLGSVAGFARRQRAARGLPRVQPLRRRARGPAGLPARQPARLAASGRRAQSPRA